MSTTGHVILSGVVIYLATVFYARIVGLRSYSKITTSDFAMTVAIGSMIATTTLTPSVTAWQGCLGVGVVFLAQFLFTKMRMWSHGFSRLVENSPLLLMKDGQFLNDNMKKSRVRRADIISKLREANVGKLSDVYAVVFETTGDISILHGSDRYDEELLEDVSVGSK